MNVGIELVASAMRNQKKLQSLFEGKASTTMHCTARWVLSNGRVCRTLVRVSCLCNAV